MSKSLPGYATLGFLVLLLLVSSIWYAHSPLVSEAKKIPGHTIAERLPNERTGNYVLVHLDTMTLELRDGTTTLATIPLVSRGKPGSYYETIGGAYANDYKELSHFSSIGHVFMPYSIHVFGNYFIHGIPYYPDGTKVSSAYSGGCIRLSDDDAHRVYDFIKKGTPIIIVNGSDTDFIPTSEATSTLTSKDMTALMVATISLEVLTQDNEIFDTNAISTTTRRTLLPQLLKGDTAVAKLYAHTVGEPAFIDYMNQKARIIGLSNTRFTSVEEGAVTTEEDYLRFSQYIDTYKPYLRTVISQE